jgi:hypothetical protein
MYDNPETQMAPLDQIPTPVKKPRRWRWAVLGISLVVLLAAAAFLAGRYLQNGSLAPGGGNGILVSNGPGGSQRFISRDDIIRAEELPETEAVVMGVFVRRQDNSVFIGTGEVQLDIKSNADDPSSTPEVVSNYDGLLVEVVATTSTQIYRDDTDLLSLASSTGKIQQKVVPGDLDEVGQVSLVSAWGRQIGDRVVADVILYTNPPVKNAPLK